MTTMPMAMAAPMHLFRLQLRGFIAAGDRGMSVRIALRHAGITERLRRKRRGLCGGGERSGSGRDTDCKFQKVPALHDFFPLGRSCQ
jgi:hypothetical protein